MDNPLAQLTPDQVAKLQEFEQKLGSAYVLAYDDPLIPARLTDEQMAELRKVEAELGVCLVAYRKR